MPAHLDAYYTDRLFHSLQIMHALSPITWLIHILSVTEWIAAIWLVWLYGKSSRNPIWHKFAIAMLPALVSAICVCVWHFFDNAPSIAWLGTVQAVMTLIGNCALMLAARALWQQSRQFG